MNYIYKPIDTFTEDEPFIIIHGVNQLMVMGSGITLAIKEKWPIVEHEYLSKGVRQLGDCQWVKVGDNQYVVNLFTQQYVKGYKQRHLTNNDPAADRNAVCAGLMRLCAQSVMHKLPVYIPKIGCGLGGLEWSDVERDIDLIELFSQMEFNIIDNVPVR